MCMCMVGECGWGRGDDGGGDGDDAQLIELQVTQVAEGKRARGWTSGSRRLSGFDARLRCLVLRAGASISPEGVGVRTGLAPWSPKAQF